MRNFSFVDRLIIQIDNGFTRHKPLDNNPANKVKDQKTLSLKEKELSGSMMRINHSGEICAQALYQGQALLANDDSQYNALLQAASEENAHLAWCYQRLQELNSSPSKLNPFWYAGSFVLGMAAAAAGDKVSLGFVAETEYQVTKHLDKHLENLPINDKKSQAILQQMRNDELQHAINAENAGGVQLPTSIKLLMRSCAAIFTRIASKI